MILVCFQDKPFNITVIQVYALTTDALMEVHCYILVFILLDPLL